MELLQKHFDTALESSDGIKKLRELILTLAMQGKLVKQDPKDQPASELLKEIQAEKDKLTKEGKIKKQNELPPIKSEEISYQVPKGWVWARLGEIGETQTGTTPATKDSDNFGNYIPFIGPGDIQNQIINYNNNGLSQKGLSNSRLIKKLSILMVCIGGSIGKHAINTVDVACNQQINTITPLMCDVKYIFYSMLSVTFQNSVITNAGGSATPIINKNKWSMISIPLPPLAEQKRIVAKIDELMKLCDKLEALRNSRNDKRLAVNNAAINRLLTAVDKNEFDTSWQFIARHFDPLYSVKENVASLKKAILTLAMQGKLVKQDTKDQPASELLKEIQAEKERLVKEGKIKKQKELSPIKLDEVPYKVPEGWVWTRLGEAIYLEMGQSPDSQSYNQSNDGIPFFQGKTDFGDVSPTSRYWCTKPTKLAYVDDILLSVRAPVGPTNIANTNCCIGRGLAALRPLAKVTPKFINYLMINFRQTLESKATGTTFVAVSKGDIENLNIPFPPLAEQKRIVSKIDELMALCDKLEKQIDIAKNKQTALFDAVLAAV